MALQFAQSGQMTKRASRRSSVSVQAYYCGPQSRKYRRMGAFRPSTLGAWSGAVRIDEKAVDDFINSFFEEFGPNQPQESSDKSAKWFPVYASKTDSAYVLNVEVPGVSREEVDVKANKKRQLRISFERAVADGEGEEGEEAQASFYDKSRQGKFQRVVRLPEDASIEGMTAVVENGVLTVTVPRDVDQTEKFVDVEVQ